MISSAHLDINITRGELRRPVLLPNEALRELLLLSCPSFVGNLQSFHENILASV